MTKMIKMSLMAAVAVAGTTASAQSLEDAIKNVEVSGYVDYRKETIGKTATAYSNVNEYSANVTLTSKVNDMIKATVSIGFDEVTTDNTANAGNTKATAGHDTSAPVGVDQAYFTLNTDMATVMAGKQNIPSVFVDQVDTAAQGAGIVAQKSVNSALTLAAAHFWQTNLATDGKGSLTGAAFFDDSYDVKTTELIAMGKVEMVNYAVHYNMTSLKDATTTTDLKGLYANVGATIEGVKVFAQTASMSSDAANTKDGKVTILGASGKVSAVSLDAKYFMGKDNNSVDVSLNADNDSKVHAKVWQASTAKSIDMTGFVVTAGMNVMDNLEAKLVYASASDDIAAGKTKDYTEIMPMITYKMSKNFTVHARYSMLTTEETGKADVDSDKSRIQVRYTF